tara:strand:+ start:2104 stop:2295 length:192 start_codon:yes stop_codon:yes gene_type:complete
MVIVLSMAHMSVLKDNVPKRQPEGDLLWLERVPRLERHVLATLVSKGPQGRVFVRKVNRLVMG